MGTKTKIEPMDEEAKKMLRDRAQQELVNLTERLLATGEANEKLDDVRLPMKGARLSPREVLLAGSGCSMLLKAFRLDEERMKREAGK
jgi:hypothetical protein